MNYLKWGKRFQNPYLYPAFSFICIDIEPDLDYIAIRTYGWMSTGGEDTPLAVYDLTLTLSPDLTVWENDTPVQIVTVKDTEKGDDYTLSDIQMSVHSGTHVDAPKHFISDGAGVHDLDLDVLTGPVQVIDARGHRVLTESILSGLMMFQKMERVIFMTDNTDRQILHAPRFVRDFTAIDASGARFLVDSGIRLVGMDALSIAPYDNPNPTHHILLGAGIVVVEGLDLKDIRHGNYQLSVMPLKIRDCDGAPARVVLRDSL